MYRINKDSLRSSVVVLDNGSLLEVRRGDETFRLRSVAKRRTWQSKADWLAAVGAADDDVEEVGSKQSGGAQTADALTAANLFRKYKVNRNLQVSEPLGERLKTAQTNLVTVQNAYKLTGLPAHKWHIDFYKKEVARLTTWVGNHGADYVSYHTTKGPSRALVRVGDQLKSFYLSKNGTMLCDGKRGTTFESIGVPNDPEFYFRVGHQKENYVKAV